MTGSLLAVGLLDELQSRPDNSSILSGDQCASEVILKNIERCVALFATCEELRHVVWMFDGPKSA